MNYEDYVNMALTDNNELKLILKGEVIVENQTKLGVVSVVFITQDVNVAKEKLAQLNQYKDEADYYMLYSCPEDTDLTKLPHYPSIQISKDDLL